MNFERTLAVKLNAAEKKWIAELQAVLDACPSKRLGFYTIGDPQISIYDLRKEEKIGEVQDRGLDFAAAVEKAGAEIDGTFVHLDFPACVHSVAG
jgi:hypothetical protein